MMKPRRPLTLLFLWMFVLPVQTKDVSDTSPSEVNDSLLVSDLSVDQFSEVVKRIVQQTLEECADEGDMEGKAKLNLDLSEMLRRRLFVKRVPTLRRNDWRQFPAKA